MAKTQKTQKNQNAKPVHRKVDLEIGIRSGKSVNRKITARLKGKPPFVDVLNPDKLADRERFVKKLSEATGYPIAELAHIAQKILAAVAEADEKAAEQAKLNTAVEQAVQSISKSEKILANTAADIVEEAKEFLEDPHMFERLAEDFEVLGIAGEKRLATTVYGIATSRLLQEPLGGCIKAASSSGKSFVRGKVVACFPPESVLIATDITPAALYYMPPGSLKNKLITVAERQHVAGGDEGAAANATLALREMMSSGRLDKVVTVHGDDGIPRSEHITQEGPIAYVETTTIERVNEEDASRMLALTTDESCEHTLEIMKRQAREKAGKGNTDGDRERVRRKHQTAQRMLRPLRVVIPFAEMLELPTFMVIARRAFPQLLGCIEAVAMLRQFQKKEKDGVILADWKDYEIAYDLMLPVLKRTFAPVNERAIKLFTAIKKSNLGDSFTRTDAQKCGGIGSTEAGNRLNALAEAGLVELVSGGKKGVKCVYSLLGIKASHKNSKLGELLTPEQLKAELAAEQAQAAEDGDEFGQGDGHGDDQGNSDKPDQAETDKVGQSIGDDDDAWENEAMTAPAGGAKSSSNGKASSNSKASSNGKADDGQASSNGKADDGHGQVLVGSGKGKPVGYDDYGF